jgi:lipid-binding SYLF domain-containing protein
MIAGMRIALLIAVLSLSASSSVAFAQPADSTESARLKEAVTIFSEIMSAEDKSIPQMILGKAEGIAIFPSTIKGGFVVGGMRGRGVISARTASGWSAPAFMTLTGGSIGLQIGGESADIVLVIMQRRGLETLVRNQFKLGVDAGVAAGPVGRDTQASTDLQLRAQILSYSRSRGAFAGVTINGSTVRADKDANQRFYRKALETEPIVLQGQGDSRAPVPDWLMLLTKYARS